MAFGTFLKAVGAQLNPFDKGRTYRSTYNEDEERRRRLQAQQQKQAPRVRVAAPQRLNLNEAFKSGGLTKAPPPRLNPSQIRVRVEKSAADVRRNTAANMSAWEKFRRFGPAAIRDTAVTVARGIPRGVGEIEAEIESRIKKKPVTRVPRNRLGEILLGKEPIKTSTESAKETVKGLTGKELPGFLATPLGLFLSAPVGPGKGAKEGARALKLAQTSKKISKTNDVDEVTKHLLDANIDPTKLTPEAIIKIARSNSSKEVAQALDQELARLGDSIALTRLNRPKVTPKPAPRPELTRAEVQRGIDDGILDPNTALPPRTPRPAITSPETSIRETGGQVSKTLSDELNKLKPEERTALDEQARQAGFQGAEDLLTVKNVEMGGKTPEGVSAAPESILAQTDEAAEQAVKQTEKLSGESELLSSLRESPNLTPEVKRRLDEISKTKEVVSDPIRTAEALRTINRFGPDTARLKAINGELVPSQAVTVLFETSKIYSHAGFEDKALQALNEFVAAGGDAARATRALRDTKIFSREGAKAYL